MINLDFKDKIEDALIHFEDAGYIFNIHYDFFCNDRFGTKVYDVLKKVNINDSVKFGDRIYISLNKPYAVGSNGVMSWKEYQWYQSELKTAINRITDDFDNVNIINTTDLQTGIEINLKNWKFKNIKDLVDKCRYFNSNTKHLNKIVVYPEYHVDEGIVLYIREIPDSNDFKRFSLLDSCIKSEYYFEEIDNDHKVMRVREKNTLERAFGKDCVLKRYEEGEAEKENPYLVNSSISKYIVAKINCDFIKV